MSLSASRPDRLKLRSLFWAFCFYISYLQKYQAFQKILKTSSYKIKYFIFV